MHHRPQLENILANLFKGKIILLYGPRQVGKTTLIKEIQSKYPDNSVYYLADRPNVLELFKYENIDQNIGIITQNQLIILDEAQRIPKIGLTLKIIHDTYPDIQLLVTGSSAFDLSSQTTEPLTGRSLIYKLYPISFTELSTTEKPIFAKDLLPKLLIYGSYPEVLQPKIDSFKALENIASNYLYKDIFSLSEVKKPEILQKIITALAFQIGQEVSLQEIANTTNTTIATVERYIDLLEKSFIVFKLPALSRNLRTEISKSRKIYFWDLGIRNYLINNLNELSLRNDTGQLWENFLVIERLKKLEYQQLHVNNYFWRNYAQAEIDYIEESAGKFDIFEFKWNPRKHSKIPKAFDEAYQVRDLKIINQDNFTEFVSSPKIIPL